ncbi:asparaginase [Flavimaricola marinus]|uniref:L-asparaginase II n=1 Tax=Flavimaricola marinus TaxID=1819565 RepID=A0A238LGR2_9RHOB|nr:asparaginase [Flavimaricola marinus]SMY08146.1 L-asparaginase II [Flavimaricola marinus]
MSSDVELVEVTRGGRVECVHRGHVVVCDAAGDVVWALGDPSAVIYPRSSCKMVQALPLLESGAAAAMGLRQDQLALTTASHIAADYHTDRVNAWLGDLGLTDDDLRCGPQMPRETEARDALIRAGGTPCQAHNVCSGKHAGFLTLTKHLKAGPEYNDISHPLQVAIKQTFEEVTGEDSPGYGIDGCSAPNHATTVHGLARAMAMFANAHKHSDTRSTAATTLVQAMAAFPELVNGHGRSATELMRLVGNGAALKDGADGMYIAILPQLGYGVAIKITDGADRGADAAIAMVLDKLGVLPDSPAAREWTRPQIRNRRNIHCGDIRPAAALS